MIRAKGAGVYINKMSPRGNTTWVRCHSFVVTCVGLAFSSCSIITLQMTGDIAGVLASEVVVINDNFHAERVIPYGHISVMCCLVMEEL